MAMSYSKQIKERIEDAADGTVFVNSDFADIADQETVRRNLNRITKAGVLRRILKGVYEKPKYSKLLTEYVATDPNMVAKALARSYHWTIAPSGLVGYLVVSIVQRHKIYTYYTDYIVLLNFFWFKICFVSGCNFTPS